MLWREGKTCLQLVLHWPWHLDAVTSWSHEPFLLVEVLVVNFEHISDKVVKAGNLGVSS